MSGFTYEELSRDLPTSTPLMEIDPAMVRVLSTSSGVLADYQRRMSKAVWRPAPGRKLGFLVTHGNHLLGLIFLASPVIRLSARDDYLFPEAKDWTGPGRFPYGIRTKEYIDMSVCVGAQPLAWHWNLGKLLALLAPTLGDYVTNRYLDEFKGVTTTSLWGRSTQYNRVYKFLGYTKGFGHEQVGDVEYEKMLVYLRGLCDHPGESCPDVSDGKGVAPVARCKVPGARFGQGANARMRRILAYRKESGDDTVTMYHGKKRGVYYHPAVSPDQRAAVVQGWLSRWGLPRYLRTKDQAPPYQDGHQGQEA